MIANSYGSLLVGPASRAVAQNAPATIAIVAPAAPSFDQLTAICSTLDAVRKDIDRSPPVSLHSRANVAQFRPHRTEQIAAQRRSTHGRQEQMTREITNCQAVEQYVLNKNSEPPPLRLCPARNPVPGRRSTMVALTAKSDRRGRRSCACS